MVDVEIMRDYVREMSRLFGMNRVPEGINNLGIIQTPDGPISCCSEQNWLNNVIRELDRISKELADRIGEERNELIRKPLSTGNCYYLTFGEYGLHRLLAYAIIISTLLGWEFQSSPEKFSPDKAIGLITAFFECGRTLSARGVDP
jgi:hypothetical protein